jgi:hypothetical protein
LTQPHDLIRTVHEFADTLRSLTPEHMNDELRATLRAVVVEIDWLIHQPEPNSDAAPPT